MDQVLTEVLFFQNLFGKLFTLFGAVALALASVVDPIAALRNE